MRDAADIYRTMVQDFVGRLTYARHGKLNRLDDARRYAAERIVLELRAAEVDLVYAQLAEELK